jgi:hypothetical protein
VRGHQITSPGAGGKRAQSTRSLPPGFALGRRFQASQALIRAHVARRFRAVDGPWTSLRRSFEWNFEPSRGSAHERASLAAFAIERCTPSRRPGTLVKVARAAIVPCR